MIKIPEIAKVILKTLNENGFEAYLVGGFVRDRVMGNETNDIDVTTSAKPDEVIKLFSDYRVIETGLKHGTVTVMCNKIPVEITTYRTESTYSDNRHPDEVVFCEKLESDLSRRDFTVNSLAMDVNGEFVDLFGGPDDISNKIIRAIGNAEERFNEDALRILRALRFSSVLCFEIDKETSMAIHKCKDLINNVAPERIAVELRKTLCGKNIKKVLLEYSDVFTLVFPELLGTVGFMQHNFHHKYNVYEHTATVVESVEAVDYLRLTALFHDCEKPSCFSLDENGTGHFYSHASKGAIKAREALKRLKFDNETVKKVELLVKQHDSPIEADEKIILRKLNRFGEDALRDLIKIKKADTLGLADEFHCRIEEFDRLEKIIDDVISKQKCFSFKDLDFDGNDAIAMGYKGAEIGCVLKNILEAVIDGEVENSKECLVGYVKTNLRK